MIKNKKEIVEIDDFGMTVRVVPEYAAHRLIGEKYIKQLAPYSSARFSFFVFPFEACFKPF